MNQNRSSSKKMLRTLAGVVEAVPPIWLMRQAGRYLPEYLALRREEPDFIAFCLNPDLASEATLQPIRRFGLDASILFADILLLPHAAGQKVWFEKDHGPRLELFSDKQQLIRLDWDRAAGELSPVYETVRRLRRDLPQDCTLIGFAGSPWTVSTYMIAGGKDADRWQARTLAWSDPVLLDDLLERLGAATVKYLCAQVEAGADVIQLFESWAEGLPQPLFERVVIRPTQAIVRKLKARFPGLPVIGFPRGCGTLLMDYVQGTGVDAVSLDMSQANAAMLNLLSKDAVLQGGLDPALLATGGPLLAAEITRLLDLMAGRPYVFNLGHGISKETPPEHVEQLIRLIRETPPQP
jgi:uroporphyrinogen decarboxylase